MSELTNEEVECIAENFATSFFLKDDDEWKQILDYEGQIPKIIREVVKKVDDSFWFEVRDKKLLFKELMEEIDELRM